MGFFHVTGIGTAGTTATHNPAKPNFTNIQKGTGHVCGHKQQTVYESAPGSPRLLLGNT